MTKLDIGILHPGAMGISLAVSAQESGHRAYWLSAGRSQQTRARAEKYGLVETISLDRFCQNCSVIASCCPPHAAEEVATEVVRRGFAGLYLDANAISPARARRIGERMEKGGASFVDGAVIGGPAWDPGETRLYLAGRESREAAACFEGGRFRITPLGDQIGRASALKMCFASYSKGSTALICATLAAAERLGVRAELAEVWSDGGSDFAELADSRATRVTRKAWRFEGEMREIAETFETAGLPGDFHRTAAEIYRRLAHFKDAGELPPVEAVLHSVAPEDQV